MKQTFIKGFTIVELAVAMMVIGILVTITSVVYSQIRNDADDLAVRQTADRIGSAVEEWSIRTGLTPMTAMAGMLSQGPVVSNAEGHSVCSTGSGTFYGGYYESDLYGCSLHDILLEDGYVDASILSTTPEINGMSVGEAYVVYRCSDEGKYLLLYALKDEPTDKERELIDSIRTLSVCGIGNNDAPFLHDILPNMDAARYIDVAGS